MTLPLAISSAGWTAIGAVGGALVGATAGGMVDWFLGVKRQRQLAKAGARLVAGEISGFDSVLQSVERDGQWWQFHGVPISSWPKYKDALAMDLAQDNWEALSQGVMVLEELRKKMTEIPAFQNDPNRPFINVTPENIRLIRRDAFKAYNALSRLAGHPEEEGGLLDHRSADGVV